MNGRIRPLIILGLFLLLAFLRITAPTDLLEGDQVKQIGYIMDILHHGHWVVQYEITGEVATKPPLYNWLAAGAVWLTGSQAIWVLKLPSLLASVILLVCLYLLGTRLFDERVGFYSSLVCIASHHFSKLMWFARTDMLLASLVLLAITLVVMCPVRWWKSPLIGFVVALSALAKGPLGPALFGLFLLAWSWEHGALKSSTAWKRILPGTLICLGICGAWLSLAWGMPSFKHTAIDWQLAARMADPEKARPFYYYLGHLFTRIAPWPILAALGIWKARQKPEWHQVVLMLVWFALSFTLLSLIPVKRHDHLFPVYAPVFLLAGVGLRYLVEPVLNPGAFWVMYPLSAALVATPLMLAWVHQPEAAILILGAFVCGGAATWCYLHRQRISFAVIAAGLICCHGLYHQVIYSQGRANYAQVQHFIQEVVCRVPQEDRLVVFQAHPLLAYELNQHVMLPNLEDLEAAHPRWIIMPSYFAEVVREKTSWRLTPQVAMEIPPREDQATLYRVEPPPQLSAQPLKTIR